MRALLIALAVAGLCVPPASAKQFIAQESDFDCLLGWTRVNKYRVFHRKPKRLAKAVRILEKGKPRKRLPKGTIIQLVPQEAMVKRGGGFNRPGRGWEFFWLQPTPDGTRILARGGSEVTNAAVTTVSCQSCHAAAKKFDFVCEDRGCLPINVPEFLIDALQRADPRCQTPTDAP